MNLTSDLLFYQCSNLTVILSAVCSGFLMLSFLHYVCKTYLYFSVARSIEFFFLFKCRLMAESHQKTLRITIQYISCFFFMKWHFSQSLLSLLSFLRIKICYGKIKILLWCKDLLELLILINVHKKSLQHFKMSCKTYFLFCWEREKKKYVWWHRANLTVLM